MRQIATDYNNFNMDRLKLNPVLYVLFATAVVGIVLALVKVAAPILNPILLSGFIAALAYPLFKRVAAKLEKQPVALLVTMGVVTLGTLGFVVLLLFAFRTLKDGLDAYEEQVTQRIAQLTAQLPGQLAAVSLSANSGEALSDSLNGALAGIVGAIAGALGDLVFSIVLAAMLLLQSGQLARLLATDLRDRPILGRMPDVMRTVVKYFGIRTRLNLITGFGMFVFLLLLGVDYAPLWGVLVFIMSYVPYIGLFVAMTPPVLLAFAEHGWVAAGLCILAAAVVNIAIENLVEPSYTAQQLHLSPAVVFVAFFFFVWLLGPLGAMLAMPITVMIVLVCRRYPATEWLSQLLTGGKSSAPEASAAQSVQTAA